MKPVDGIELEGEPPAWGITGIEGFVESALGRAERDGGELPDTFCASFCHWGERNAVYHSLTAIADVFEPLYRLVHFTSCGKPFLVAIMTGADAEERQSKAMRYLPWSEHYRGRREDGRIILRFIEQTEDTDADPSATLGERSLRQLFESGEINDL